MKKFPSLISILLLSGSLQSLYAQQSLSLPLQFIFSKDAKTKGALYISPEQKYQDVPGYGLEESSMAAGKPAHFSFSVKLPEGNYEVRVLTGEENGASNTTIRAECRRLLAEEVVTRRGQQKWTTLNVHLRDSINHSTGKPVKLKEREKEYLHWDNKLTLHFNGKAPGVRAIEIKPATKITTVFLAGNSTVVDQANIPYAAWGQMIPSFFQGNKVAVANYAESGETLKAFEREGRLAKILSLMQKGDYLFIEFAHNDQKPGGNYLEPFTTYKETLKKYIELARSKGGIPVLVTSMHRRHFDSTGHIINTLLDYPEAVRQTGLETRTPVIDLNAMSKTLYEAWGPVESIKAFVHFPEHSFPGQDKALKDDTHFTEFGAYQLARCVAQGMKDNNLPLAKLLRKDLAPYDPAKPPRFEHFSLPLNTSTAGAKPDGN
ncbi:Lysophospholipase L1 [Cnuella takakiae]|uniref:Lysophospholipase L1 n=1 Tax=Cnuella takakiae TaxID=1302690 RepID=A0A1M4URB8_9BACT|nr:rhamnogalacturonan acetylesterase [Cnuella takakiae]OLY92796.1 hypothetical protein BUE76_13540 [Cnuella takakiae]SHE59208.1 Lysophospholipase L1 [Cnuella takakiae]